MKTLPISVAFWDYDRTAPLVDGRVRLEGYTPNFQLLRPQDTFVVLLDQPDSTFANYH